LAHTRPGDYYADHFARRAAQTPSRVAISFKGDELTYSALNARANRLAHHLQSLGAGPEFLIAVCLDRSIELMVTLLAIWKAGAAYLPLDPADPEARVCELLADAQPQLLITKERLLSRFREVNILIECIDCLHLQHLTSCSDQNAEFERRPNPLAYVIYTSGSTGQPKGVEITHPALLNHNLAIVSTYALTPQDRVLQFSRATFDVSIEEIFPTWLAGSTLVLRTEECAASVPAFLEFLDKQSVSIINIPTAFWHELVHGLQARALPSSVRLVVIGGEKAGSKAYQVWKKCVSDSVQLINGYGPTEATITATCFSADPSTDALPIGRPIAGAQAFILDDRLRPVANDAPGQLYLGGPGLARGYRNQPLLTAGRFLPNPFHSARYCSRLYKTGDLVRCRPDGNLEFIGRVDEQIKIRGFRIEPSEVEAALNACSEIKMSVVTAREDSSGTRRLVAYYVGRQPRKVSKAVLLKTLKQKLPRYMLPSAFVELTAFPLTSTGKVDRRALPEPGHDRPQLDQAYLAPRSPSEVQLTAIWGEALAVNQVGIRDNFFDLGGDSLLATRILSRIRASFGLDLPLDCLFDGQTIEGLAARLDSMSDTLGVPPLLPSTRIPTDGRYPVAFVQERLWFLQELHPDSDAHNIVAACRVGGELNLAGLEQALVHVCQRHEALRTTFHSADGDLTQIVHPSLPPVIPVLMVRALGRKARQMELQQLLEQESRKPFDLERGPLLRAAIFKLGRRSHVLLFVMHHIVSDGWSLGIFFAELESCYNALANRARSPRLPDLPVQYRDYAAWRRETCTGDRLAKEIAFWKTKLEGAPAELRFPNHQPVALSPRRAGHRTIRIAPRIFAGAVRLARIQRTTIFTVVLASLAIALRRSTGQTDFVIGTVVAGRDRAEIENLIGCFMNFLPLRLALPDPAATVQSIQAVSQVVREAQLHQDCPFEKIVAAVNPERGNNRNPLYNVAFVWQQFPTKPVFRAAGLAVSRVEIWPEAPQLDLRFEAEERDGELLLECEFDADLFALSTIDTLLASTLENLTCLIRTIPSTRKRLIGAEFLSGVAQAARQLWSKPAVGKGTFGGSE
jgi:amino acid adenylation domain-containing protein